MDNENTSNEMPEMGSRRFISRRNFIAAAAAVGALGVLGSTGLVGCAPKSSTSGATTKGETESYDIVIIGAGGAGMAAALAAKETGVESLVILEKEPSSGGNTQFSSSGMNASETKFQKAQGIEDSNELFAQETYVGGHNTGNMELITYMCDNSASAIDWLDGMGITLDNITTTGGMSVKRCHRPTDGSAVGRTLAPGLAKLVTDHGIELRLNSDVTSLITDDSGAVTGVNVTDTSTNEEKVINAKAVIMAAGGLGSNPEMITKYRPDLAGYVSTNQPGATGDGYVMAEAVGAELIQMDQIQIHPTVDQGSGTLIAEGIRGSGAILVNSEGKRFTNEMGTRDVVSAAELAQPGAFAWEVLDQQVYDANKAIKTQYETKGLVITGSSIADLASKIGVDPATLQSTIDAYNAITTSGAADEFGRTSGCIAFATGNMYAIKVAPGIHHEMGGIKINTQNQALKADGTPVPNLYAAGEVTGGIHGNNRIGGNAVCDIMVYGRNVGELVAGQVM